MRLMLTYQDGDTEHVDCDDTFEFRVASQYVEIDGELYGNENTKPLEWVCLARSERGLTDL